MDKLTLNELINPSLPDEEKQQSIEDIIKLIAVNNLVSKENLKTNTRIKYGQVAKISKLYMFGEVFKSDIIKNLADNILQLQISINGLGRKELVDLVGKVYNPVPEPEIKVTRKDIFK